jgi:hypothetical protein
MNPRLIFLTVLIAGRIYSQEAPAELSPLSQPAFRVLAESIVRQPDGGTVTFKRVEPPVLTLRRAPVAEPLTLSAEELERMQRLDAKEQRTLSISATVHKGGLTVLRWSCHGKHQMRAVCNVDFRHLADLSSLETEKTVYAFFMGLGVEAGDLSESEALAAKSLPAGGEPAFVLLHGSRVVSAEDEQAAAAMEALLDHYAAHRAELVAQFKQREAERAAQELARQNAPPPGPRHAVVHFWPLQPEQREALTAKRLPQNPEPAKAGTTEQSSVPSNEGGTQP